MASAMTEPRVGAKHRPLDGPAARVQTRFFSHMGAVLLLAVLVGFAPSFYLRGAFFEVPAIEPRVWVHGAVLTAWFVAFWLQATLIARQRAAWHRRAGWLVAAIALAAVATSLWVTLVRLEPGAPIPLSTWSNLANATAFATFVSVAVARRRDGETHKRLMLLASIAFLQPALARVFFLLSLAADVGVRPLVGGLFASLLFLVPLVVHDVTTRGKLHPATLIGGAGLIVIRLTAVFVITGSSFGQSALRWLT
jgi:hypothetical protein